MPRRPCISILALAVLCSTLPAHAAHPRKASHAHHRVAHPRRHVPRGYFAQIRRWHRRDPDRKPTFDARGVPELVLEVLNTREQVALEAATPDGGFSALALERAARALRDQQSGDAFPIDAAVLDVLYRLQTHFSAHSIRVVSAYRASHPGSRSRHGQGRAVDLIVPGASDKQVAAFLRGLGFAGVGVYTVSGFVHVDVRARSYFWVDGSGPGQRNRARPVRGSEARRADARARQDGRVPPRAAVLPRSDVDALWDGSEAKRRASAPAPTPDDDAADDDDTGAGG